MQLSQTLAQTQTLKMNPQLYQSIKLLELPSLDLREKIQEELEKNPALEIIEDKSIVSLERDRLDKTMDTGFKYRSRSQERASDEYRQFIEGALAKAETLQEHLLWQLQLEQIDNQLKQIAETLIQNLDDDGFYIEEPITLFNGASEDASGELIELINKGIGLVRSLDPAGCCTKDYKEALMAQVEALKDNLARQVTPEKIKILLDNMELIERGKYSQLAKKTGLSEEDVIDTCEFLKTLSPFPGRSITSSNVRFVIPDIRVTREPQDDGEDELVINLNDETFPVLGVSKYYEKLSSSGDKAARDFARENIKEALLFIEHLKRRNQTLIRVANAIVQFQRAFFEKGPKYLAPLTLKDIAKELDIHETTVSRVANGKYMDTEWGIYEIRWFFTNSVNKTGSEGVQYSKESVKEVIKEIIFAEDRNLSDQEISLILQQKGIALARRTVAKYRKELDMGSSYTRRPAAFQRNGRQ